ncbi:MAG: lysylphosphatidylglycerol synthase transmembrane domain-containing protein [Victivallales bacterium]
MKSKFKKIFWFVLRIVLAAGIIGWLVYKNYDKLAEAVLKINPLWLIPAVLLYALHIVAGAWRWQILLNIQKIHLSFLESLSLTLQALFFSLVIPGGAVGGDLAKAGFIAARTQKGERLKGVFTILIDRVIGMIALFALAGVVGIMSLKFLRSLSGIMELVIYALIFGCIMGLASAAALFFHRNLEKTSLFSWLISHGDRMSKGALHNLMNAMDNFRAEYRILLFCFAISILLIHLNIALVVYLIGHGTGAENLTFQLSILTSSLGNTVGALPITPSGVGTRDFVFKELLSAGGITGQSLLIPLIYTSIFLCFNLFGGLIFIFSKKKNKQDLP